MQIERIENEKVPYELLYLADEDEKRIEAYRNSAVFFAAYLRGEIVGMTGLENRRGGELEIVCLAVYEHYQNRQIGTALLERAIAYAKEASYRLISIKTGNCGIQQLYLYQRCGFRITSIVKDHFLKHYRVPIFENGIRCVDQVVLHYTIYNQDRLCQMTKAYWDRFVQGHPEYSGRSYEAWHFCYGEHLPNKLLGLVKLGKKHGTSSALQLYGEGEQVPKQGDLSIVTYGNGLPGCIIETKEVRIKPFCEISEEEARLEGEGDLSLSYWREVHEKFFQMEYEEEGKVFSEDIPVLFERFAVIYDEDRK